MSLQSVFRTPSGGSRRRRLTASLCIGAIVLVALVVSVASLALATSSSFPDVPASHQYYPAITDLASRGIIGGYANGNFGPDDSVTRQQFAKMIVLTGGYPVSESDVCPFTDVAKSDATTFYPDNYVAVCAAKGITTGKTPTTFDPTGKITRYQMVSMVVRVADNLKPGLLAAPPATWAGNATWAANPAHGANAARAEYNGLLVGLDLAALSPTGDMSRGEVAQVLHNLLAKLTPATTTTTTASTTTTTTASTTTTTIASTTTTTEAHRAWTNLHPSGSLPSARAGHSMVYDPTSGKVILFGGLDLDFAVSDDTWAYNTVASAWTNLNPSGSLPSERMLQSMVYDPTTGKVILFGGADVEANVFNDTWAYDSTTNTWSNRKPGGLLPSARGGHSMVYDPTTHKVILFGGSGDTDLNDTWAYDPAANIWTNLKPSGDLPSARDGHSMVYDSSTGKVILFGGSNESDPTFNDTWAYDPVGNTWTNLNPSGSLPSGRVGHSMVYDPTTGKVILFGGLGEQGIFDDIWAYGVTP